MEEPAYKKLRIEFTSSVKGKSFPYHIAKAVEEGLTTAHEASGYKTNVTGSESPEGRELKMSTCANLREPLTLFASFGKCMSVERTISYLSHNGSSSMLLPEYDFDRIEIRPSKGEDAIEVKVIFTPL
jgi:hypothetical protein